VLTFAGVFVTVFARSFLELTLLIEPSLHEDMAKIAQIPNRNK
jgi:hypothetical protein